eukprot:TRINITY_DN35914_c0_g1_i1.p1 TRINITY_DN35914_c0_g1~~TRINITY_DN35914_c0_g1_i1.p1  ORF type:complete len:450 (+),score=164.59 TRINITY_DN35914_c0_g1_i1:63-1412(+)
MLGGATDGYSTDSDDVPPPDAGVGEVLQVTKDGGVQKECLVEGQEHLRPRLGAKVKVFYRGYLEDGSEFDSSHLHLGDEPFEFELGTKALTRGCDEAILTMRRGEKCMLTLKSEYAFGKQGRSAMVPPNATVRFEVELVSWEAREDISEEGDRSVLKTIKTQAWGHDVPEYESIVKIDLKGPGFDKQDWEIKIGEDLVPPGVETCLLTMKRGEASKVLVQPQHLGDGDWGELGLAKGEAATYLITMHQVERAKSRWHLKDDERIPVATEAKEEGNQLYKAKKLVRAQRKYQKAVDILDHEYGVDDEATVKDMRKLKLPCLTNLAAVQLGLGRNAECIENCGKALELDGQCVKAILRRAKAHLAMDNWSECEADLERILGSAIAEGIDSGNADAKRELERLRKRTRAQDKKDKRAFAGMFSRMVEEKEQSAPAAAAEAAAAGEPAPAAEP